MCREILYQIQSIDYCLLTYQWSRCRTTSLVSPKSNLWLRTTVRRNVYWLLSGRLINFMESRKERYFDPAERACTLCRCVSYHLLRPFDICTCSWQVDRSYSAGRYGNWLLSFVHVPTPIAFPFTTLVYRVNLDLDLYSSKSRTPSHCSVKYGEIIYLQIKRKQHNSSNKSKF